MVDFRNVGFLVGAILLFIAVMMLLPLGVSALYGESDLPAIAWSALLTAITGCLVMVLCKNRKRELGLRDGFAVVSVAWMAMACAGALPFILSGAIPAITDAFFESMSGFTTTGASILGADVKIESMTHGILFWRSLTHWIGGMGIILLSLAILPLLGVGGMQLYRAEVPGPTKDKLTPRIRDTAEILWVVYVSISILEILLLWAGQMDLFDAACHTFGTMATGGFSTRDASIAAYSSQYVHYVIIVFMFIAGTNFALHYWIFKGRPGRYWASREFRFYVFAIVLFCAAFILINFFRNTGEPFETNLRNSLFQTVSILTTTGYVSVDWELWGSFASVLFVLLMLMGGMAGSTGGGIKVIRIQVMIATIQKELRQLIHPQAIVTLRIGRKLVEDGIVRNILAFLAAYALILCLATAALSALGLDLETSFGAAIASLSNIGPGLGQVGATDNYAWLPGGAKWLLSFLMMLGRLEVFTILVLFNRSFWRR